MAMDFQEVCSHFRIARQGTDQAQAYCPVHKNGSEKNPSLTISKGENGGTLLYCHVCGKTQTSAILNAVGLSMSDILPNGYKRGKSLKDFAEYPGKNNDFIGARFVESYDYGNKSGYCYTKCRISFPNGSKKFRFCRTDVQGYVTDFRVNNRQGYAALYPFECLQKARDSSGMILYVEGEKDANNANKDGFHAVTAGAADDWKKDLVHHFEGLEVIVVPDRDVPGYKSAARVANDLSSQGISVRVIHWPESFVVDKGDYSDYIDTFPDRSSGLAAFRNLIESALTPEAFKDELRTFQIVHQQESRKEIDHVTEAEVQTIARKILEIEEGKIFPIEDLKCGELIGKLFEDCRYNVTAKSWYWYDGKRWIQDFEGMHIEHAAAVFAEALIYYSKFYVNTDIYHNDMPSFQKDCGSLSKRARRVAAIQDAREIRWFTSDMLDRDKALFNCQNGVLNLDTFEFTPHKPELLLSKIAGCDYNPGSQRKDFLKFVNEIMQNDDDKVRFLQLFTGYVLGGSTKEECFLILFGATTRNGKGTFCETLMRMFGDYGSSIRPESLAVKRNKDGSSPSEDIARLAGVRFLNCSEPAKGLHLDEALVKSLTGGDKITARHLFERSFEFYPQFTIMMNVNYLPLITDTTLFTSGRVLVLPFERHFEEDEQDKGLKLRLQESDNLSAVLNWALEGLKRYKTEGLRKPNCVNKATKEYAEDSDKIKRFFADELIERKGTNVSANDVYQRFTLWCRASGYFAESKQTFFQLLRTRGLLNKTGTVDRKTVKNVISGYILTVNKYITNRPDRPDHSDDEYCSDDEIF